MNGFSILMFIGIILLFIILIVGMLLLVVGLISKQKKNPNIKTGLVLISLPLLIIGFVFLYETFQEILIKKPSEKDLIGKYQVCKASGLINENLYNSYTLEFKENGRFFLSPTPNINVCDSGKYSLNLELNMNEISFLCNQSISSAHLNSKISGYTVEFIIGDPDSGESICFNKIK